MKNYRISGVLAILIFGFLLICGCTGTGSPRAEPVAVSTPPHQIINSTVLVIPPPTPTVERAQDPIIGVWRENYSSGYDDRYRFNADGSFVESFYLGDENRTLLIHGMWSVQGSNSYTLRDTKNEVYTTFIFDPEQNAIYPLKNSISLLTHYQGDVMAAS